jgi:phage gpG-like protein
VTAASANLRSLAADLAHASGQGIEQAAAQVVREYAGKIQDQAMQFAPVKTGALRDSITVSFDSATSATIGPRVPYGPYQEFGTGSRGEFPGSPYLIRPKNAKRLSFVADGKRVVTTQVTHPGVRAKAYMRRAVMSAFGSLADDLARQGALLITRGPNA